MTPPSRLWKNQGGYQGEPIDIAAVLHDDLEAARRYGWTVESLIDREHPPLYAFSRKVGHPRQRLYFSAGIHGDEPAGPLAIRQLLQQDLWPPATDLWLLPCLNPEGFAHRLRGNAQGIDLNRDYRHQRTVEVQSHVRWLEQQPDFDSAVCLHEDWEAHGFYLYELNPEGRASLADRIIAAVSRGCPIDPSDRIDGWPAREGIIRPEFKPEQRADWPEAFYLVARKSRHSYTMEAPSDFPLSVRVAALVAAVKTFCEEGTGPAATCVGDDRA